MGSAMTTPADLASRPQPAGTASSQRFAGKRVAMVSYSAYPFDPRPRRAVDALLEEGASVDLICLESENAPRHDSLEGLDVVRIPLKHRRAGKFSYAYGYGAFIATSFAIFAVRSLARRYDLVYVHNMPDVLVVSALIPKALGAKVVLDLHDPMPELMTTIFGLGRKSRSVRLIRALEKWSVARADSILTVNLAMKQLISSRSCRPEKIGVVMNSPDGQIFPFRPARLGELRDRNGSRRFVMMYHGSIVERNGLDVAVEALERVRHAIPSAELRICGKSTPFLERVMDAARAKNLQASVRYLGPKSLEEIVAEIENCDVGLIPNHRNIFTQINTPTRIFEYLASGKPVIAPSTPGILDYFKDESLLFFEPGEPSDLARQVEYAFNHPHEVMKIAQRGQEVYLEHTWERERQMLLTRLSETLHLA
jgi:glycosyltransferase involved in cell wall biosynthesis